MTREIPLTQGKVALVSDDAYERVMQYKWCAHKDSKSGKFYAEGWVNGRQVSLHIFLMQPPSGMEVDHIDRDGGLNCQWDNMRLVTRAENQKNRSKQSNNTSGYKGVSYHKGRRKWRSQIKLDGYAHTIGYFDTAEDAARAYDAKACELHGEYAVLNFPDEWEWNAEEKGWKPAAVAVSQK